MEEALTYNDVQIKPRFSFVRSRKDVDLSSLGLKLPVISSNMDTVTNSRMAIAMNETGGVGCLHRFQSIEDNIKQFKESFVKPWVSIGIGPNELERAEALVNAGANTIVLDVAHGANIVVLNQAREIRKLFRSSIQTVVGNFSDANEIRQFIEYNGATSIVDVFKVGIGGGSACTTRIKTGCGVPSFSSIYSCKDIGVAIIADGGIKTPGDIAKALAAGAHGVMLGGMLAGTDEAPGELVDNNGKQIPINVLDVYKSSGQAYKLYRGSASKESYEAQGKDESWRTAEGEAFMLPYKGSVKNILQDIEGGLRSAFSYVDANDLFDFQTKAKFIKVTSSGYIEATAHGKRSK